MNQTQLDRAVASITGESRRTIRRLGFSLAEFPAHGGDRSGPDVAKYLDWDQVARSRFSQVSVF